MNYSAHAADGFRLSDILIVDDHPLYRDALEATLRVGLGKRHISTACSLSEAFAVLDDGAEPDLILLDLKLPDVSGLSGFRELKKRLPETHILVISSLASADLVQTLLDHGAMGFLPKESSAAILRQAVSEIERGRRYVPKEYRTGAVRQVEGHNDDARAFQAIPQLARLTPQQSRILKLICEGKPNKQIAYDLSLAETTVKAHITALLRRLGVRNRTQAAVLVEGLMPNCGGTEPEVQAFLRN